MFVVEKIKPFVLWVGLNPTKKKKRFFPCFQQRKQCKINMSFSLGCFFRFYFLALEAYVWMQLCKKLSFFNVLCNLLIGSYVLRTWTLETSITYISHVFLEFVISSTLKHKTRGHNVVTDCNLMVVFILLL